jgi:hypothetical protein
MLRHYYIVNDLDDLELVEHELESTGITEPQIHVLSQNDAQVEQHHLHEVESILKLDVVHSTEIGAIVGVFAATFALVIPYLLGWTDSNVGWMPFIFLAIVVLGFCTWEGGFLGIQTPNVNFIRFHQLLNKGKHILFVDVTPAQEQAISLVMKRHHNIKAAGFGAATPQWVIRTQDNFRRFMKWMP